MMNQYFSNLLFDVHQFTSVYWSSFPILALAVFYIFRKRTFRGFLRFLFPPEIYLSRSFKDDLAINGAYIVWGLIVLQAGLVLQVSVSLFVGKACIAMMSAIALPHLAGGEWPVALVTVLFALAADFGNCLNHRMMHRTPWLWQFHKVHHSAEHLTPLTQFRSHPVEPFCREIVVGVVMGIMGAVLLQLGAITVENWPVIEYLGVYLVYYFTIHFRHSHHWVSFGPLSYIFNSPAMHQIHHSIEPRHRGMNYGIVFSFWDMLFGSFYYPKTREQFRIGLDDPKEREQFQGLWGHFWTPFRLAFTKERRRRWLGFGFSVR